MKTLKTIVTLATIVLLVYVLWGVFSGQKTTMSEPSQDNNVKDELTEYSSSEYKFTIKYPQEATLITDKTQMQATGYMPMCDSEYAVACFIFDKDTTYTNSNFNGAGVFINIANDKTDEITCMSVDNMRAEVGENRAININGKTFVVYNASDAAMSHQSNSRVYRTFYNSTCYEIVTRINTTTYEVYEEGSINKFTDDQKDELQNKINAIVASFVIN